MNISPKLFVELLKNKIIGQDEAKRVLAIALRNRWRRSQLNKDIQKTITPKNILMIGPTGVGKTAIIRAMADIIDAPMIKVEATRYTQIGYVGEDVKNIIADLVATAKAKINDKKNAFNNKEKDYVFLYNPIDFHKFIGKINTILEDVTGKKICNFSDIYDIKEITEFKSRVSVLDKRLNEVFNHDQLAKIMLSSCIYPKSISNTENYDLTKQKAKNQFDALLTEYEDFLDCEEKPEPLLDIPVKDYVENTGIVFIDEIDKLAVSPDQRSVDNVGKIGVQRDLLAILDGTEISTNEGIIKTENIIFIVAGAFHNNKVSDLMPELLGRLPIRVDLDPMDVDTMVKILKDTYDSPIKQYQLLLKTEGVIVKITDDAIYEIAKKADEINRTFYSMGARTLHTIVEKVYSKIAFTAFKSENEISDFLIDKSYVEEATVSIFEKLKTD